MSPQNFPATLRIPFVRRCTVSGPDKDTLGLLLDLSLRGVYVATDQLRTSGDQVLVKFQVPGNVSVLSIAGLVAWVQKEKTHPVHGLPQGFGVRFMKLEADEVRLIARAIQTYCQSNPIYRQYL
jgi:uncharacterized protein (TIGR02266 family)